MQKLKLATSGLSALARNPRQEYKIALIYPHLADAAFKTQLQDRESLALGYLAASLKAYGYTVVQINAERRMLTPLEVVEEVLADPAIELVGISAGSQRTYIATKSIARSLKEARPSLHICVGGIFPTAADLDVIQDCSDIDTVVRGEGEQVIVELAGRLATGSSLEGMLGITHRVGGRPHRNASRPRLQDLDEVGFPTREDIESELNAGRSVRSAKLVASRGCYARCTFCSIHQIYGDHLVSRRSPVKVVEEMEQISMRYGIKQFAFMDDLFITPSQRGFQWVDEFCDILTTRNLGFRFWLETRADTITVERISKLVQAGMYGIFIGVESGVDSVLKRWDKEVTRQENETALHRLRDVVGLKPDDIRIGYIMFDREMTFDELKENYLWLRQSGHAMVHNLQNRLNVYWGTPEYKKMVEQGLVDPSPLGDRWAYEILDSRVNEFEKFLRRFLKRTHERYFHAIVPAKKAHIARRYSAREDSVPWIMDVLSQALRCLEQFERATWYYMFDECLARLGQGLPLDERFETKLWDALELANLEIITQSNNLSLLSEASRSFDMLTTPPTEPPQSNAVCWLSDGGARANIWLAKTSAGYSAVLGVRGRDYYDHECVRMQFTITNGVLESTAPSRVSIREHALVLEPISEVETVHRG